MKIERSRLDRAFKPQTVVVIGDSKRGGFHWLHNEQTFKGKLYLVQVSAESVEGAKELGVETFSSLRDVPGLIDLVIVNTPRTAALEVLNDCIARDVGAVHFFTAGFSETGVAEYVELERQLRERAEQANLPVIGPNCRGIFNPAIGLRQISEQYSGFCGPVGLIMQSGGHAMYFSREAHLQGIDINKSVSFGNGLTLHAADFVDYLGADPDVRIIGIYLEGMREGQRFFNVLRHVAARKPVVIWKGGWTADGGRAVGSHTASLAVPDNVWNAMMKQCGAVRVDSLEELIDTIKALLFLPTFTGDRVAAVGGAGGQSVELTDALCAAGFRVPPLSKESYDELSTFFSVVGGSYRNPLDTDAGYNRRGLARIFEIVDRDPNIDVVVLRSRTGRFMFSPETRDADIAAITAFRQKTRKPLLAIQPFATPEEMAEALESVPKFQNGGVPVFPTTERATTALRKALDYYRGRQDRI